MPTYLTTPPPLPDQQPVTADEQVGEQHFHDVVCGLRRDVEGVREVAEATTRTMPIHPPQAEAIDHKVGAHPSHQPECQRLPFAEKTNQRNDDFRHPNRQHQLPKLDADDWINHRQEFGVAKSTPNLGNSGDRQESPRKLGRTIWEVSRLLVF